MEIEGKPVLSYILERLQRSHHSDSVIVATSIAETDEPIVEYCRERGIEYFRGSLENVSDRFVQCALHYELDFATRINGDNLFTDPTLVDNAILLAKKGDYDFVSNVDGRTFPTGMSVEVVRTSFYRKVVDLFDSPAYHEHVTLWLYEHPESGEFKYIYNDSLPTAKGLNLALDCEEDLNFVSLLLRKMDKPHTVYGWEEIVKLIADE